jgi:hypothetical protein
MGVQLARLIMCVRMDVAPLLVGYLVGEVLKKHTHYEGVFSSPDANYTYFSTPSVSAVATFLAVGENLQWVTGAE